MIGEKRAWLDIIQWDYHREVGGLIFGERMGNRYKINKLVQLKNMRAFKRNKYKLPNFFILILVILYQRLKYGRDLLGEWHSHPDIGDVAAPSEEDERIIERKVKMSGLNFYLLGIAVKDTKKKTKMNIWYYSLARVNEKRYNKQAVKK